MLVKKKAIREGIKFTRVFWKYNSGKAICGECKCKYADNEGYRGNTTECDICDKVLMKTGVDNLQMLAGYIVK